MRSLVLVLILITLMESADAGSLRRTVRIDGFGAWNEHIIGSPECPGTTVGSDSSDTLVQWQGWTFSGRASVAHLFDRYCQVPAPGTFNQNDYNGSPDEAVLEGFLGDNLDDSITGRRYSFLDRDRFDFDPSPTGFQWMFFFFPDGLTLVGLYGFVDSALDDRSYIEGPWGRIWDGGLDGYNGEFFCFLDSGYIGTWDGTLEDGSPCLAVLQRIFVNGFESTP